MEAKRVDKESHKTNWIPELANKELHTDSLTSLSSTGACSSIYKFNTEAETSDRIKKNGILGSIVGFVKKGVSKVGSFVKKGVSKAWSAAKSVGKSVVRSVSKAGSWVGRSISRGVRKVGSVASKAWKGIKSVGSKAWKGIKSVGSKAWKGVKSLSKKAWNTAKSVGKSVWKGVSKAGSWAFRKASKLGRSAFSSLKALGKKAWGGIKSVGRSIGKVGSWAWKGLSNAGRSIGHGLSSAARWAGHGLSSAARWAGRGLSSAARWAGHGLSSAARWAGHGLASAGRWAGRTLAPVGRWFRGVGQNIWRGTQSVGHQLGQFGDGLYHGIADPAKMIWNLTGRALYDPRGALRSWSDVGRGLAYGVTHPAQFLGAFVDWKDLSHGNFARWAGNIAPAIVAAVVSDGATTVASGGADATEAGATASRIARVAELRGAETVAPAGRLAEYGQGFVSGVKSPLEALNQLRVGGRSALHAGLHDLQRNPLSLNTAFWDVHSNPWKQAGALTPMLEGQGAAHRKNFLPQWRPFSNQLPYGF